MAKSFTPKDPQVMNLMRLFEQFGTDEQCRQYLEELRWPDGLQCPRCEATKGISRITGRGYECEACRYQYSVLAGTIFHDTKLPLSKWFAATYLMVEARKGVSANQMKRTLGVSYKTAWYLCHRIRAAMGNVAQAPLTGVVEVDETYIGGRRDAPRREDGINAVPKGYDPLANKTMVMGAVARDGGIRLSTGERRINKRAAKTFIQANVSPEATVYTDSHSAYTAAGIPEGLHDFVNHNINEWVRGDVHTNTVESACSLMKRSIVGSYHQLSTRHLPAYLDEMEWRFNNRENPFLFRDTMLALINSSNLPYSELTA